MKKKLIIIVLHLLVNSAYAQVTNTGTTISIEKQGLFYVNESYTHNNGTLINNGEIVVENKWVNNTGSKLLDNGSVGLVRFTGGKGILDGKKVTFFPKLSFTGDGVFDLNNHIEVGDNISIGDTEIRTNGYNLSIFNPDIQALMYNKGFFYTQKGSFLFRKTGQAGTYIFPFGSDKLNLKRPVVITPKDAAVNTYGASFIDKDPSDDGYSRMVKKSGIGSINDNFYHKIIQIEGKSPADLLFYAGTEADQFNNLVSWADQNIWDIAPAVFRKDVAALLPQLNAAAVYKLMASNNKEMPFAFSATLNSIELYNAFSPDGDGINERWEIKNIDLYPDNDLKIFDRSGNLVYKKVNYQNVSAWDASNVSAGTYIYILRVGINGEDKMYKGTVTVVKK
ncbi:gliding motility-associated C-terminal domain-containing protein [Pedobacter sp.]|uniref:gliding motility-associated C-terminal domain-containing protein n=1 Tax=Pedobacter sp. TaxID=1411316 RepID=UPI00396D034D